MEFTYMAAPLEDISEGAFRELCYNHGADVTFTEMTRLKGLLKTNRSSERKIVFSKHAPTIIQLLASNEHDIEKFLATFIPPPNFKGFNLNMGCPSPEIISVGLGCASVKRVEKTKRMVEAFKKHNFPISLKIRLGLNAYEKSHKIYLRLIKEVNADFFIVHARHGKDTSRVPADFSVYAECVATGKNIIANGDITTKEQVEDLKKIGIKGVMLGRAATNNPDVFNELKGNPTVSLEKVKEEYVALAKEYNTHPKYLEMVLPRMGKKDTVYTRTSG